MKTKIEFSRVKEEAKEKLGGNLTAFAFCMVFSTLVMAALLPRNYILSFIDTVELKISDYFRIFIASSVSESLMLTLTSAMYRVIFKKRENEKKGIGLLLKNANLVFPSLIVPILITKISFGFINFLSMPDVCAYLYDCIFINTVSYISYSLIVELVSLIASLASICVTFAYILTPCVIADNPQMSGIEAMKVSRRLMKKRKFNMFLFILSFALWYMIGFCCFGFGMLWAHAYAMTAVYVYYTKCREIEKKKYENSSYEIRNFIERNEKNDDSLLF